MQSGREEGATYDVAIIGAGPVGVEAALRSVEDGYRTVLIERGEIGEGPLRWGHVRMFTPWAMNTSARGRVRLPTHALPLSMEDCPTGRQLAETYLQPVIAAAVREKRLTVWTHAGLQRPHRIGWPKSTGVGSPERAAAPFGLNISGKGRTVPVALGEVAAHQSVPFRMRARVLIDATGTRAFADEQRAGEMLNANLPSFESDGWQTWVRPGLVDPAAVPDGDRFLVIGGGASAATDLATLTAAGRHVTVLTRSAEPPFVGVDPDPLPNRATLLRTARESIASGAADWIGGVRSFGIEFIDSNGDAAAVYDDLPARDARIRLTHVVGSPTSAVPTGYRDAFDSALNDTGRVPDTDLLRELQVHLCYATEGPMKLAAHLMGQDAAAGDGPVDCLTQSGGDADLLKTTEPGFFILGAKSYGRRSNFLLRAGLEQVDAVFDTLVPQHLAMYESSAA